MQFNTLATVALGFFASGQAAMTASQVVVNIKTVTTLSGQTNDLATRINGFNIFALGPQVVNNFREIVQDVSSDIAAMGTTAAAGTADGNSVAVYSVADQQSICNAFRDFVVVHQQLLATIIGKHSIFANTPFTAPVAAVLRAIEGGVDTLAFGLINLVPSCAAGASKNQASLDMSLNQAITEYSVSV